VVAGSTGPAAGTRRSKPTPVDSGNPLIYKSGVLGSSSAYLVGSNSLAITNDGGGTWRDVSYPPNMPYDDANLDDVAALGNHLWLTADNLHVSSINSSTDGGSDLAMAMDRSSDGGRHWQVAYFSCGEICGAQLSFTSSRDGVMLGQAFSERRDGGTTGVLYRTTDGGASWHEVGRTPVTGSVSFVSDTVGWISSSTRSVTVDGDNNYTFVSVPAGELFTTVDGGKTWRRVRLPSVPRYGKLPVAYGRPVFFDSQDGVLPATLGANGAIDVLYMTTDGGRRWVAHLTPFDPAHIPRTTSGGEITNIASDVSTPTASSWRVLAGSILYRTDNAGRSWTSVDMPTAWSIVRSVTFTSPTAGIALRVLKIGSSFPSVPYRTANGGLTWLPAHPWGA
jgi:photosystem II stability/assembly factor-like uncharacterized protein